MKLEWRESREFPYIYRDERVRKNFSKGMTKIKLDNLKAPREAFGYENEFDAEKLRFKLRIISKNEIKLTTYLNYIYA